MTSERSFPGIVHWADQEITVASIGRRVRISRDGGQRWEDAGRVSADWLGRLAANSRVLRRATRRYVHHVVRLGDRLIVFGFRGIHLIDLGTRRVIGSPAPIQGSRPLSVCLTRSNTLLY